MVSRYVSFKLEHIILSQTSVVCRYSTAFHSTILLPTRPKYVGLPTLMHYIDIGPHGPLFSSGCSTTNCSRLAIYGTVINIQLCRYPWAILTSIYLQRYSEG